MPKEWLQQWGTNVRIARKAKKLSQYDLADLLHVRASSVCRWEKGNAAPSDAHKIAIATALETDVRVLFPLMRNAA